MNYSPAAPFLAVIFATSAFSLAWAQDANLPHIPGDAALRFEEAEWILPTTNSNTPLIERVLIAEGEAAATAPEDASRYSAQEFVFPAGALRLLKWQSGPVLHQITFETQLYMLKGSATVGVGGHDVVINAGDAVFQPSGILRNIEPDGETIVLSYIVSNTTAAPKAKIVRGENLDETIGALWNEDESTVKSSVKHYVGDGNSIRHVRVEGQGRTPVAANGPADALIYLVTGRMKRVEDGIEYLVNAGDAIRQQANKSGYWEILAESEFILTDMPFDPSKPRFKLQRTQSPSNEATLSRFQERLKDMQK